MPARSVLAHSCPWAGGQTSDQKQRWGKGEGGMQELQQYKLSKLSKLHSAKQSDVEVSMVTVCSSA
jgi:hypothetical protein